MQISSVRFITLPCIVAALAIPAAWAGDAAGKQWKSHTLRTGELHGECMRLNAGERLHYAFAARDRLDFNINFTQNEVMHFLLKKSSVRRADAVFRPTLAREYCMMWSNPRDNPVEFRYRFEVRPD